MGAAAAALGAVLACLLPSDVLPDAHAEAGHAIDALLATAHNAPRLARSSAAKSGAAAGLAALLGVRRRPLSLCSSPHFQATLHMLPGLPAAGPAWLLVSPEAAGSAKQALQACALPALSHTLHACAVCLA